MHPSVRPRRDVRRRDVSRRDLLRAGGGGIGMMALRSLLSADAMPTSRSVAGEPVRLDASNGSAKPPHFPPRAKRMIWLFMHGGPSHVDLFDPKPELTKYSGKPLPESFGEVMTRRDVAKNPLLAATRPFRPRGKSGLPVSDYLPNIAELADDLCVVRSLHGDSVNHPQSVYQMNTGSILMGHPSVGSWLAYGLGSENADMPYDRFVRLQVAGDLIEPGNEDAAIATSFCLSGPDMPDINSQVERKHLLLNEIASTVGSVFLSLQVGCAQCHDHKFDPISQADFYRLRAYFDPAIDLKRNRSVTDLSAGRVRPTMQFVAIRGDWRRPGPEVSPDVVRIASTRSVTGSKNDRVALARWLSSPGNPLTARSIVNRVWQHHFGNGLSGTPSDFGVMGDQPTHPELLDYLASELIRRGWRLKDLHREILLSATYRTRSFRDSVRASGENDDTWERLIRSDPDNRLLGRYPRRRLEGEIIRDAMFAVSGSLSRVGGGPGIMPPLPVELKQTLLRGQWSASEREADHYRRSVYLFARRNLPYPMFATFDRPSANTSCAARDSSTTAPQALYLFNSSVTIDAAKRLAERLRRRHPDDRNGQIDEAYRRLFSRSPDADELQQATTFLREVASLREVALLREVGQGRSGTGGDAEGPTPLVELCRALLNANPFLYID